MANIEVTVEVESAAPPEKVYEFITDPSMMTQWVNGVQEARWAEGSGPEPGGRFNLDYKWRGEVTPITMEITAAEPGRRFEYHTVEGKFPIEVTMVLDSAGSGTKITYTQNALSDSKLTAFSFIVTSWMARPMMRKALRKDIQKMAEAANA